MVPVFSSIQVIEPLDHYEKWFSILGNSVTISFGLAALWTLWRNRNGLSIVLSYLQIRYLDERSKRVRNTLARLEALNYDDKNSRAKIFALMGQLSGQLLAVDEQHPRFGPIQERIRDILAKKTKLTEAVKLDIVAIC